MKEFVEKLKNWIESQENIKSYRDEYNNYCYGSNSQKHIFHLHIFNSNADIEINNPQLFKSFLEKFNQKVRPHEWHPNNWLIIELNSFERFEIAKEIINLIIHSQ